MRRKSDILLFLLPIMWDGILIFVSFPLAYWVRFYSGLIPITKGIPRLLPYLLVGVFALMVWLIIFYLFGVYDTRKVYSFVDETYEVVKGAFIGTVFILAPIFFYRAFTFSRIVMALGCSLGGVLIVFGKVILKGVRLILYHKGIGIRRACIVGGGERATEVIAKFKNPLSGYSLVGQVIDQVEYGSRDPQRLRLDGSRGSHLPREKGREIASVRADSSVPVLGNLYEIREVIEKHKIDLLLITFPLAQHRETAKILLRCNGLGVEIRFVPDPYELLTSRIGYYEIDGFSLLGIREFPLTDWNALLKRGFDIVLSGMLLLLFSPLFLLISIIIKLSSRGPLFYRQQRVGKDGKVFHIIKFRSMRIGAEELTGPIFASQRDPRVTRIGSFLRRWGIDELPQLFNVLKGNMSLVGPRPERPEFVERFGDEIFRYFERHKVKPGITGWAQVHGLRGNTSIKERVKYDLYYIENWSFGLDIKILLRTLSATIKGENAY